MLHTLLLSYISSCCILFFFTDTATTEIYTLSLHDALPIWPFLPQGWQLHWICEQRSVAGVAASRSHALSQIDRKSTRLNSSHTVISYAVFCLKKKKKKKTTKER